MRKNLQHIKDKRSRSPVETFYKWLRDTNNQQKNKQRMFTTTQQIKGERPQMYGNITFQKQSKN